MPFVRIDIQSGKTTAYKRAILHGVRDGIADALGVDHDRIVQRIIESPAENIDATDVKSDRLTLVEISMLPGRGPDLKERLYHEVARQLAHDPGIEEHDLVVLVNDPPAECFFMNGRMQGGVSSSPTSGGSGGGVR
jgi:phenylpyruvate tautomerase PptA (4-oxalocrotonate tautomerase family)